MKRLTGTALTAKPDHLIDPDLQLLIDCAPPLDDDQRHGLRELLSPSSRPVTVLPRQRQTLPHSSAEAA